MFNFYIGEIEMREIKFRAWDNENSKYYHRLLIGNTTNPDGDVYVAHLYWSDSESD